MRRDANGRRPKGTGGAHKPNGPLWKTVLCKDFPLGQCKFSTDKCIFAHGPDDLRASPDLTRTSVCPRWLNQGFCERPGCRYAHAYSELRQEAAVKKTKLCNFFMSSMGCIVGSACRFAHGKHELFKSEADEQRRLRREAFMQSAKPSEPSKTREQSQPCMPPPTRLCFIPVVMHGPGPQLGSHPLVQPSGYPQHGRAVLRSASARLPTNKLPKRKPDAVQSPNKMAYGSTLPTNVEIIRAAMSTPSSNKFTSKFSTSSTSASVQDDDLATEEHSQSGTVSTLYDVVIRNTFVDTMQPKHDALTQRRSKSL